MAKASANVASSSLDSHRANPPNLEWLDRTRGNDNAAESIARSLLVQVETGRILLSLVKERNLVTHHHARRVQSAKRIVAFTEEKLLSMHMKPADLIRVTAEVERLRCELHSVETFYPAS